MRLFSVSMILAVIFCAPFSRAEEYPDWQGFPPFVTVDDICEFDGEIYAATAGGLMRYNPETNNYHLYYKNNGLPNNTIQAVATTSEAVYLGFFEDGLWRFEPDTETFTQVIFPEYHIKTSEFPSGIAVYDIVVMDDNKLYVAHSVGIDRLDLANNGIKAFTKLGNDFSEQLAVKRIRIDSGRIWACTDAGLASADESDPNLEFPDHWDNYSYTDSNNRLASINDFAVSNGIPLAITNLGYILLVETATKTMARWTTLSEDGRRIEMTSFAKAPDGRTVVAGSRQEDNSFIGGVYLQSGTGLYLISAKYADINTLFNDSAGRLWIGTEVNGLQCYTEDGFIDVPKPSDVYNNVFYTISLADNDIIWTSSAYRDLTLFASFQRFDGESWSNYPSSFFEWSFRVVSSFVDSRNTVWLATWGKGVYVVEDDGTVSIENDTIIRIDEEEEIVKATDQRHYNVASDICEDGKGNIWIANWMLPPASHGLESIATSGAVVVDGYPVTKYQHYSPADGNFPDDSAYIRVIEADDDGWVWCGMHTEGLLGIYVGDDPFDKSDYDSSVHVKNLRIVDGIHAVRIDALAPDMNGNVWVGSQGGLNLVEKKGGLDLAVSSFNDQIEDVSTAVQAVTVDHNNNKWVGTADGLVKLDENNEYETEYTTSNSGIFANDIYSLTYDDEKDVLWIGTIAGLCRFDVKSGEMNGAESDIRVYPNPFEIWGYDSFATFPGLKENTVVKIYSFNGEFLNEVGASVSDSGSSASAQWDGRNFEGGYVGSGVYFFTGTDVNGNNFRDKMVVIRR